jgi:hypothetical protein
VGDREQGFEGTGELWQRDDDDLPRISLFFLFLPCILSLSPFFEDLNESFDSRKWRREGQGTTERVATAKNCTKEEKETEKNDVDLLLLCRFNVHTRASCSERCPPAVVSCCLELP